MFKTKKEKLKQTMDNLKKRGSSAIILLMVLPYSKGKNEVAESIVVHAEYFEEKWNYIDANYDDNLVMKHNKDIKIKDFV